MTSHVVATVRSSFASLRQIRSVRRSLPRHALLTLIHALVISRVDYCNSMLAGISGRLLARLQSILNAAARLVFKTRMWESITSLIRELHWLRVPERIEFRLCVLAYRCLQGTAPPYLASGLHRTTENSARRSLRSADTTSFLVPLTRRATLGDRAFFVAAPRAWNSLSPALRGTTSLVTFRRDLKRYCSGRHSVKQFSCSLGIDAHWHVFTNFVKCPCNIRL